MTPRHLEWVDDMPTPEDFDLEVCVDCLQLIANGEDYTEAGDLEDRIAAIWPPEDGWRLAPNCPPDGDCGGFSWSPCDACGSRLGGDRHYAVAFRVGVES